MADQGSPDNLVPDDLIRDTRSAWRRFVERAAPVRPELFRYCRSLTGSVWDAEDLAQDALLRSFARLSELAQVASVRAYLFRVASNLWIDQHRRSRAVEPEPADPGIGLDLSAPPDVRNAARHLFLRLPPAERAAVLLKDVFDFSLEETATALGSTVGGVKAALHRGRVKLAEFADIPPAAPHPAAAIPEALLRRFVDAFNARDIPALTALMRADATSEMVGMWIEEGRRAIGDPRSSILHRTFAPGSEAWRAEAGTFEGDPVLLLWTGAGDKAVVGSLLRLDALEGLATRLRYYYFCPEVLAAIGADLGIPVRDNGYLPTW